MKHVENQCFSFKGPPNKMMHMSHSLKLNWLLSLFKFAVKSLVQRHRSMLLSSIEKQVISYLQPPISSDISI